MLKTRNVFTAQYVDDGSRRSIAAQKPWVTMQRTYDGTITAFEPKTIGTCRNADGTWKHRAPDATPGDAGRPTPPPPYRPPPAGDPPKHAPSPATSSTVPAVMCVRRTH